jgi:uridine kinase
VEPRGRRGILDQVADAVTRLPPVGVGRIGIDGVDGAGKTMFADELAEVLEGRSVVVVRASLDGFHRPRPQRWARGRGSPEGYYLDSYDYPRLRAELLDPVGPGGSRQIRRAVHDVATDQPVDPAAEEVTEGSVLVVDGIFLHRPELAGGWDLSVYLHVPTAVSVGRCAARDGTSPDVEALANRRYVDGQRLYLERCRPERRATMVIDNTDLGAPVILSRAPDR